MTISDTTRAGRREWIGLAGMQTAATISAIIAVGIAILAVAMLRNVGSGTDREAAAEDESEQGWQNQVTPDHDRAQPRPRRTAIPAAEC